MDMIPVISRWIHIGTAIILVGGTFFFRFVLTPAAASFSDEDRARLRDAVINRWKKFVHVGIALFIVSGLYNFVLQIKPHHGQRGYHMLIGTKILLALVIFFIAEALVGRSKAFEGMRKQSKLWQLVMLLLAAVIVGISGYAKVMMPGVASQ